MRECESAKVGDDGDPTIRSVTIVGLGLIGGSLARDLHARGVSVYAWDADEAAVRAAAEQGIAQPARWDAPVDAVVLAVPVLAAHDVLRELAGKMDGARLVTDVGSTKTSIVRLAETLGIGDRFVGSHPLAGDHRSGWDASRQGMFDGARVYLCPTWRTGDEAMRLAFALWTRVGGRPEVMDADLHDVRLAWTSHLPQAVSTVLAITINQTGMGPPELGPGGRDVTRLAGSDPAVWADILIDNADALNSALAMMSSRLGSLHQAIVNHDRDTLVRALSEARQWHQGGA